MVVFPYIKLNLGLNVLRRRNDGYHDLETCFIPVKGCCDVLEIMEAKAEASSLSTFGIPIDAAQEDNLVMKAYRMMEQDYALPPVEMALLKNVPAGSGVGAGSSDASHALLALNELFGIGLDSAQLEGYALRLGSDCPYFIKGGAAIGKGRGEELKPIALDLADCYVRVVFPGVHVSTKEAFAGLVPAMPPGGDLEDALAQPRENWRKVLKNDFETTVFALHPVLKEIKDRHYSDGAFYASMSGSGSAIYGLHVGPPDGELGWQVDTKTGHKVWMGRLD